MIIKYCSRCSGRPYTSDISMSRCPKCNTSLLTESVEEFALEGRPMLQTRSREVPAEDNRNDSENTPAEYGKEKIPSRIDDSKPVKSKSSSSGSSSGKAKKANSRNSATVVRGIVSKYSSSGREDGNYRRLPHQKIGDGIIYGQRMEDVIHRFYVVSSTGRNAFGVSEEHKTFVNVHGTIHGGMIIEDNAEVEVHGTYKNGVLMARKVYIINNGYRTKVKFQVSVKAILYSILVACIIGAIIYFTYDSHGAFLSNIKSFLAVWAVMFAALIIITLLIMGTRLGMVMAIGRRRFPILAIILASLLFAMLFVNAFGIGATVGGVLIALLKALLPAIVVLAIIIFAFKLILKR